MKSIVLVDKPAGMTSFELTEKVAQVFGVSKAGHTGTLDPNVTGLMVIALDEARKAMPVLMGLEKEYAGRMLLHAEVPSADLSAAVKKFTGDIIQKPPVKSRVARVERKRTIHAFRILRIEKREVLFSVVCEAGTYIRKLIHDLGAHLGCGAQMTELRRTRVGPFSIGEAVVLSRLSQKGLIPLEQALERTGLKKITIPDTLLQKARNGVPMQENQLIKKDANIADGTTVGIYDTAGNIIALGKMTGERIRPERIFL
jgi:H/ACA ribonucleoprotein complex subunit 4